MRSQLSFLALGGVMALSLSAVAGAQPQMPTPQHDYKAAPAGKYAIDPKHTGLVARVPHMGFSYSVFRFQTVAGTLAWDPANPAADKLDVSVDAKSITTAPVEGFTDELTGDKFLNADKFSTITFKSTQVVQAGETLKITGDLTFLGVTRPVTLLGSVVGSLEKHPFMGKGVVGFSATGTVKRSDWGMIGTQSFLGDDVTIIFEGEFDQQ